MTKEEIQVMNKQQLLDQETLFAIFQEESQINREYLRIAFIDRAAELSCKTQAQQLYKAFNAEIKENSKKNKPTGNKTDFGLSELDLDELNCGGWIADEDGIRFLGESGDKGSIIACYHPIFPIERLFNIETRTEKITLKYKRDAGWKDITVDKGIIASASKIVKLADYGVAVTSETSKLLVRYLCDMENLNSVQIKNSTSKFGWHGNDFIPYDKSVVFDDESRFKDLAESLNPRGSFDTWLTLTRNIRKNTAHYEPQVYLAASFASILLSKLNMLPFIVNLWGTSGKGKTVNLMLAASVWADPSENKFITDSYSTQNAFEIRLDILNHLPLCMDDLSKVRDKLNDNFTDLIYLLCSGKGKDRSNVDLGLNKVKTWQCTILSNMERPLATDTMKGGAINRILDFEMQEGYIFENGNAVVEILKDNYGFAGAKFIELVKDLPVEVINNIRKDFEQKIKEEAEHQGSVKEEKQILPMSVLLTADKIATDYIFEDGIYLDIPTMVSQLKDVNEVSEGKRAYDAIVDATVQYKFKFVDSDLTESWGNIKNGYVNILPSAFKKIALDNNFSTKAFCSWARSNNLIKTGYDNKYVTPCRINGDVHRCYSIKLPNADEERDFHPAEDEPELPFK
jgi:hypothetical protein